LGWPIACSGSRSDADDVVQNAYIRFAGAQDVHNPEAFLVTVVTRLCLDRLKSAKSAARNLRRPLAARAGVRCGGLAADAATELADDLSFALLLAVDRLSPLERAAFLLHDVFDVPFSEIARMLDRTRPPAGNWRRRARRAVRDTRPAPAATPDSHARLLSAFSEAVASGDVSRLAGLLRADAVAVTDGGGRKTAALKEIMGADKVARFFIALAAKNAGRDVRIQPTMINGTVGALLYMDGEVDHTLSMAIDGDRIAAIYIVRNPDKCVARQPPDTAERSDPDRARQPTGCASGLPAKYASRLAITQSCNRHVRLDGVAADMRGQHDVREAGQRVRHMRFFLEHVKTRRRRWSCR